MRALGRTLQFTREGKIFVALTFGVGIAAINSGNNLLYLMLGTLLTSIIGSGILSEVALWGVRVERVLSNEIYAKSPFLVEIRAGSGKRHFSSYSIDVDDQYAGRKDTRRCYFLKLAPERTEISYYQQQLEHRGSQRIDGFAVSTRFPFSLFRKSRRITAADAIVVFPAIYPAEGPNFSWLGSGVEESRQKGRAGEFHGLREYSEHDDPRDIHWRKSAQSNRLLVREYDRLTDQRVSIFLDNHAPHETASLDEMDRREAAVSHAASLAVHYLQLGYAVSLITRTVAVKTGTGSEQRHKILRELALLDFAAEERPYVYPPRRATDAIFVRPGQTQFRQPSLEPPHVPTLLR